MTENGRQTSETVRQFRRTHSLPFVALTGRRICWPYQVTLSLGFQVMVISSILGVLTGMISAWRSGSKTDRTLMFFAVLGFATPGFRLAFIMI